jgi:hypothetical protein
MKSSNDARVAYTIQSEGLRKTTYTWYKTAAFQTVVSAEDPRSAG